MRLICYHTSGEPPKLIPAPMEREWMDRTNSGFAYRCLPLNIANAHGWLILNPAPFVARWNGEAGIDAVEVRGTAPGTTLVASSHFGSGVLTFNVNALFRTEPGYDLAATGPFNQPKDEIHPQEHADRLCPGRAVLHDFSAEARSCRTSRARDPRDGYRSGGQRSVCGMGRKPAAVQRTPQNTGIRGAGREMAEGLFQGRSPLRHDATRSPHQAAAEGFPG